MFTGIVTAIGSVEKMQPLEGDLRVQINTGKLDLIDVQLGDSIAVNGVCLTVVDLLRTGFWADVSEETIRCTTFNTMKTGQKVNLEKALTPTTRMGGHLVSGHIDGLGQIVESQLAARSIFYKIQAPAELMKYIAPKGSITVDGVSLTVNAVRGIGFHLNIIPQTQLETIFNSYRVGQFVNLEVDLLARYIERLLKSTNDLSQLAYKKDDVLTESFLAEHGFVKR